MIPLLSLIWWKFGLIVGSSENKKGHKSPLLIGSPASIALIIVEIVFETVCLLFVSSVREANTTIGFCQVLSFTRRWHFNFSEKRLPANV